MPPGSVRCRLDLAYDGGAYAGWARQRDRPSVQAAVEDALATVLHGDPPRLTVAGRTDAGVHARGQVAHVDLPAGIAEDHLLLRKLNGLLAPDIRVRSVAPAPPGFDARFSALSRTYCYRVADRPDVVDPLLRSMVLVWPRPLDLTALQDACPTLLGTHDFAAFCRRREGATTVRGLLGLGWEREAMGLLVMTVRADAFCHSMVRSLVGALLSVGDGRRDRLWLTGLLDRPVRATDVVVAPPHGLVLEAVEYPADDQLLPRQGVTRNRRT